MKNIFVLTEHRQGVLRDVTFEILSAANDLAGKTGASVTALLLGDNIDGFASAIKPYAHRIFAIQDGKLAHFNADAYQTVLMSVWEAHQPDLLLIPQTGFGADLAPSLAVALNAPLITDCFQMDYQDSELSCLRQMYGGKVNSRVTFTGSQGIVTLRASSFPAEEAGLDAEVVTMDSPLSEEVAGRKFVEYVEAALGDVDISQADIVVGVGRGIKEKDNIPVMEALAEAIGGVLACSRPVVDAGWLPKDRQVGSSGKVIKPKLYIALGISGAFQHTSGMKAAETVVAVNKDCNAPIFGVADYGIVGDLFKVVPVLTEKIKDLKG